MTQHLMALVVTICIASACDKAAEPYAQGSRHEAAGAEDLALSEYQRAVEADPKTESGKKAAERIAYLTTLPATVDRVWCARLRSRIEPRLQVQAAAKHGSGSEGIVRDFVSRVESDCVDDAGHPTAPIWTCYWGMNFDDHERCDQLLKAQRNRK